jgi:hypothetical protein
LWLRTQDVLLNAIYLSGKIPPFVTDKEIAECKDRQMSMCVVTHPCLFISLVDWLFRFD